MYKTKNIQFSIFNVELTYDGFDIEVNLTSRTSGPVTICLARWEAINEYIEVFKKEIKEY